MNAAHSSSEVAAADGRPDADLLADAFARFQPELLGTLYYLVGNLEDAQDAIQEAFVKCWRHRDELDSIQNMKAWIFRIALNTGRDLRSTAWRRRRMAMPEDGAQLVACTSAPSARLEEEEDLGRLREAIAELRPEEQEVFLLRQNGGLSYEQIAQTVEIPLGTVKTRMRLALARLGARLRDPVEGTHAEETSANNRGRPRERSERVRPDESLNPTKP